MISLNFKDLQIPKESVRRKIQELEKKRSNQKSKKKDLRK